MGYGAISSQYKTSKGKIVWPEVKVALLTRLGKHQTQANKIVVTRFASTSIGGSSWRHYLQPAYSLKPCGKALLQRLKWFGSLMEPGFWRLYQQCFAHCAVGILDFIMPLQHLQLHAKTVILPDSQIWFARMRHQLRHGFGKRIIKELDWLSRV